MFKMFTKIKTINKIVKFVDAAEKFVNANSEKIKDMIELAKKIIAIMPEAKEEISDIITYLTDLKKQKGM